MNLSRLYKQYNNEQRKKNNVEQMTCKDKQNSVNSAAATRLYLIILLAKQRRIVRKWTQIFQRRLREFYVENLLTTAFLNRQRAEEDTFKSNRVKKILFTVCVCVCVPHLITVLPLSSSFVFFFITSFWIAAISAPPPFRNSGAGVGEVPGDSVPAQGGFAVIVKVIPGTFTGMFPGRGSG